MTLSSLVVLAFGLGFGALPHVLGASVLTYNPDLVNGNTYDYIIVGGGLAGLTVRLIQSRHWLSPSYQPNYSHVDQGRRAAVRESKSESVSDRGW